MTQTRSTLRRTALGVAAGTVLVATPVLAHHGWGGYGQENFVLQGTLETASLGNPHGVLRVRGKDGNTWTITLGPAANQVRAGLTDKVLLKGATIAAHGKRHLNAGVFEVKTERLIVDAKTFDIYPDRLAAR